MNDRFSGFNGFITIAHVFIRENEGLIRQIEISLNLGQDLTVNPSFHAHPLREFEVSACEQPNCAGVLWRETP
jgi:hypothetical protein